MIHYILGENKSYLVLEEEIGRDTFQTDAKVDLRKKKTNLFYPL
jgi:hypothetical protein